MLRGNREFATHDDYTSWLHEVFDSRNRSRGARLEEELAAMEPFTASAVPEYTEVRVRVTGGGTIRVKTNTYSVPSRLKDEWVRVRVYDERLEVCYALYGNDIDDTITPLEAGLGWIVKLDKGSPFQGRDALVAQKARGVRRRFVGFRMDGRAIPRHGYPVLVDGRRVDMVRSGAMSPTLGHPIGTTYLPVDHATAGSAFEVEIRGERHAAVVVKRPFFTGGSARKGG